MTDTPQAEQPAQTGDFGLRPNMAVEVLTMENRLVFIGRVESVQNGAVILRDTKGNELPRVTYNRELKLRFFQGSDSTLIYGKICGSTDQIWKLDRLESRVIKEQRAFFRQRISTSTQGTWRRPAKPGVPAKEGSCQVLDVSAGGLLISSGEPFQVGDRLRVDGVCLTPGMAPFRFDCQVRRVERKKESFHYGCKLEALPSKEQDRLLQAIFTVQREEIRLQKERGSL